MQTTMVTPAQNGCHNATINGVPPYLSNLGSLGDSILHLNSRQTPSHSTSPPPLPPHTCSSSALEDLSVLQPSRRRIDMSSSSLARPASCLATTRLPVRQMSNIFRLAAKLVSHHALVGAPSGTLPCTFVNVLCVIVSTQSLPSADTPKLCCGRPVV